MISSKKQSNIRIKFKKCYECRRKFKTTSELFIHLRRHKLKRRNKNKKKQKHVRVQIEIDHSHQEETSKNTSGHFTDLCFKCDICEMKFNQLEDLKSHKKIHLKIIGATTTTTTLSSCLENQNEQNSKRNSFIQSEDLITTQCDLILNDLNNSFSCLDDRTQLSIEQVDQCKINFLITSDVVNQNDIILSSIISIEPANGTDCQVNDSIILNLNQFEDLKSHEKSIQKSLVQQQRLQIV